MNYFNFVPFTDLIQTQVQTFELGLFKFEISQVQYHSYLNQTVQVT
jgi:hypothetical protein